MSSYGLDPNAMLDIVPIHSANVAMTTAPLSLPNAKWIDIAKWDYVVLLIICGGGTSTGPVVVTPAEADTIAGPDFPLDGTNGAPDFSRTFTNGATISGTNSSKHVVIRTRSRRRFLNVRITNANGTFRPNVYLLGFNKRATTAGVTIDTAQALVGPLT